MSFYSDRVYPHLVSRLGDPEPIRAVRQRIISLATGVVLEIGVGSGANFMHYNSAKVSKLYGLEPNPRIIPLADGTIDTVVSTFTLGTIAGVEEAIRGIHHVLRPGGRLIFFELTRSPDLAVLRWQQWWEPIQHRLFSGLYLTRDIPALLSDDGFQIERVDATYLTPFPRSWAYACWGIAIPQAPK